MLTLFSHSSICSLYSFSPISALYSFSPLSAHSIFSVLYFCVPHYGPHKKECIQKYLCTLYVPFLGNLLLSSSVSISASVCLCVRVSKSLRKWTQTDTKVTFHPPTHPPVTRKLFLISNERYGKNKTFLLR